MDDIERQFQQDMDSTDNLSDSMIEQLLYEEEERVATEQWNLRRQGDYYARSLNAEKDTLLNSYYGYMFDFDNRRLNCSFEIANLHPNEFEYGTKEFIERNQEIAQVQFDLVYQTETDAKYILPDIEDKEILIENAPFIIGYEREDGGDAGELTPCIRSVAGGTRIFGRMMGYAVENIPYSNQIGGIFEKSHDLPESTSPWGLCMIVRDMHTEFYENEDDRRSGKKQIMALDNDSVAFIPIVYSETEISRVVRWSDEEYLKTTIMPDSIYDLSKMIGNESLGQILSFIESGYTEAVVGDGPIDYMQKDELTKILYNSLKYSPVEAHMDEPGREPIVLSANEAYAADDTTAPLRIHNDTARFMKPIIIFVKAQDRWRVAYEFNIESTTDEEGQVVVHVIPETIIRAVSQS